MQACGCLTALRGREQTLVPPTARGAGWVPGLGRPGGMVRRKEGGELFSPWELWTQNPAKTTLADSGDPAGRGHGSTG